MLEYDQISRKIMLEYDPVLLSSFVPVQFLKERGHDA